MTTADLSALPARGYLTEEVRELYGLPSHGSVWKLARKGKIPGAYKIANQWRFSREKVDAHLQGNHVT